MASEPAPKQPAKPAANAPQPRPRERTDVDPVMAELLKGSAQQTAKTCPQCKGFIPANGKICTTCGYNTETGKVLTTRVFREKAPPPPPGQARAAGNGPLAKINVNAFFIVLTLLTSAPLLAGCAMGSMPLALAGTGLLLLTGLPIWIWLLIVAFRTSIVSGLLCLFFPPYALYFALASQPDEHLGLGYLSGFSVGVAMNVLTAMGAFPLA